MGVGYEYKLNPRTGNFDLVAKASLLQYKGLVDTTADLPLSNNSEGDYYTVKTDDHFWKWNSTSSSGLITDWVDAGATTTIAWTGVTGRPSSLPVNIDDAVTKKHIQGIDTSLGTQTKDLDIFTLSCNFLFKVFNELKNN